MRIINLPEVSASLRPPATILQPCGLPKADPTSGGAHKRERPSMADSDTKREMLRHSVATLAYRGTKAVRGASDLFASFKASETTRTPAQILAHIGDLLDWALSIAK